MARTSATVSYQAIELKGSLLPGTHLEQVARLQAPLQKEADDGLSKGERLWERAAQSVSGLHSSMRILREVLAWPDLRPCSGWQKEKLRQAIGQLCSDQWRSVAWLAALLQFEPRNLSDRHLTPMLKDGLLEGRFPDIPSHPEQAYRFIPSPAAAMAAAMGPQPD